MALGGDAGMLREELLLHLLEHLKTCIGAAIVDIARQIEILHAQRLGDVAAALLRTEAHVLTDDQRSVTRPQEAWRERGGIQSSKWRDADEARQLRVGTLQFLGHERTQRRILNRTAGHATGAQVVGGASVIGLFRAHRADEHHLFHVRGELGQVFADFDAGDRGGDFLVRPAIGLSGFQVEGVHLAGTAGHPQEDARTLAFGAFRRGGGEVFQPAGHRVSTDARGRQFQPFTTRKRERGMGHGGSPLV